MCLSSRAIILRFNSNTQWQMFLLLYSRHVCPSEGHKHGVSIQSSINLGDTLLQITCEWKTAETWFLAKLFIYQSCIVSQTLDFFHRMATIFILITWLVKTEIWNKNLLTEEFGTDDITEQGRSASLKAYQLSSEFENCFCSKCSSHFGRDNGAGGRGRNWTHHLRQKNCHVIKATRGHERSVTP